MLWEHGLDLKPKTSVQDGIVGGLHLRSASSALDAHDSFSCLAMWSTVFEMCFFQENSFLKRFFCFAQKKMRLSLKHAHVSLMFGRFNGSSVRHCFNLSRHGLQLCAISMVGLDGKALNGHCSTPEMGEYS